MSEFRYRAFISYSHVDEPWARWLQRALEGYRIPARVRARGGDQAAPRRVGQIFRDRVDLSSSPSLGAAIDEALERSEFLIVVCSPAAARSEWVNEEVRRFQALGRSDHVLCMVVDGDPGVSDGERACFPPALCDGIDDEGQEPLAADPRLEADGRNLALLKLVAAILGLRLDDLRQRDGRRRNRRRAVWVVAGLAVLCLTIVTGLSLQSEREQRNQSEQMATFIVDLAEELQDEIDSTSLGLISEMAMRYMGQLDEKSISPETGVRVAQTLRQIGDVGLRQGELDKSIQAFTESRDLLRGLHDDYPGHQDVLFELSQAEFYVGDHHFWLGDWAKVYEPWQRYLDIAQAQHELAPENPLWLLEYSYAKSNLVFLAIEDRRFDQALFDEIKESVVLSKRAMDAHPGDPSAVAHYANVLAFAADGNLQACQLMAAREYREQALQLAREASEAEPANNNKRMQLGYAHAGLAGVTVAMGDLTSSVAHRREALRILQELSARDPADRLLSEDVGDNLWRLARVLREQGQLTDAEQALNAAGAILQPRLAIEDIKASDFDVYLPTLVEEAILLRRMGRESEAVKVLEEVLSLYPVFYEDLTPSERAANQFIRARFERWQINGTALPTDARALAARPPSSSRRVASCEFKDLEMRLYLMAGDRVTAAQSVRYLEAREYRDPEFLRICGDEQLCASVP